MDEVVLKVFLNKLLTVVLMNNFRELIIYIVGKSIHPVIMISQQLLVC